MEGERNKHFLALACPVEKLIYIVCINNLWSLQGPSADSMHAQYVHTSEEVYCNILSHNKAIGIQN